MTAPFTPKSPGEYCRSPFKWTRNDAGMYPASGTVTVAPVGDSTTTVRSVMAGAGAA